MRVMMALYQVLTDMIDNISLHEALNSAIIKQLRL